MDPLVNQGIEIALQEQHGRHPVDRSGFTVEAHTGFAQGAVRFGAGEPFIPELHFEAGVLADAAREFVNPFGLRSSFPAHIQGVADQDQAGLLFPRDPGDGGQIRPLIHALKRVHALSREAQFIADGDADPLLAEIQSQYSHDRFDSILTELVKAETASGENRARRLNLSVSIVAAGVVLGVLYYGRAFLITSITAVIISFLLDPFVQLLMRFRFPRSLASLIVCLFAALAVYAAGMGLYVQASGLLEQLPQISERAGRLVDDMRNRVDGIETKAYKLVWRQPPPPAPAPVPKAGTRKKAGSGAATVPPLPPPVIQEVRIHQDTNPIGDFLYPRLASLYEFLLMASFVPFLVYFLLSWGGHVNRAFLQFFIGENRVIASKSLTGIGNMVRAFVVGNAVLGVMLALTSTLGFWLVNLPFPLLAGPISGFLSLIPYVGLPLALVPPILAALSGGATFSGVLLIVMMVAALHLLALNFLYPKIVGARVHLNPLVVTFALMFWSFIWDASGLILAIPMTAAFKAVCDNVRELRPIGRFLGD
jgi:predicted PurR-regulated permease PerM